MCLCVYVSMCIQQQLTTLKNNDLLFQLFLLFCLCCLYCLYSVYTYKQQQTPKILFSLFFIFFFCFFSLFLCFLFFLSFAAPQDYYTPVYAKIRPIFFPSFSTFFLRFFYVFSTPSLQNYICDIVREKLFEKSLSRALFLSLRSPQKCKHFQGPHARAAGFCECRTFAQDSCASLRALSESSALLGIKIHAHVADFYGC